MTRVTQTHVPNPVTPSPGSDRTEVVTDAPPLCQEGHVLAGRYRIERFLDRGGMGEVYAASDLLVEERVAVKIMREPVTPESPFVERFRREVQLARRVTHPNVCRIFDMGMDGPLAFLSMELLSGETLARRIARAPLGIAEALPLVQQMASALQAVHAAGVIHRDFKTGNVFLVPSEGGVRAVVADFGVARSDSRDARPRTVTHTGIVLGTPAFMAPEQVEGKSLTPAIDVYALGVVMFNMLTGRFPFDGESAFSVAARRVSQAPASPRVHLPDVDPTWERVILRCLARDPRNRFHDVGEVAAALQPQPATISLRAPSPTLMPVSVEPPRVVSASLEFALPPRMKRLWIALGVGALVAAVTIGVGVASLGTNDAAPRPRPPSPSSTVEVRPLTRASAPAAAPAPQRPPVPIAEPVIIPGDPPPKPRRKRVKPATATRSTSQPAADDDAPLPVP